MHYSPSSIVKYLKCPYAFYLSKKIEIRGDNVGIYVHRVLQHFWDFDLPKEEALQASIDKYWDKKFYVTPLVFENFIKLIGDEKPLIVEEKLVTDDIVCIPDLVLSEKIVDYKTHNTFTKKVPTPNKIQGVLLSQTLKKLKGLDIKNVEFWYLKKPYVQKLDITEKIEKEVNDIVSLVRTKVSNNEFPKDKSSCYLCDYRIICQREEDYVRRHSKIQKTI